MLFAVATIIKLRFHHAVIFRILASEGFPVIFLRFEDVDERNCDNKEEISPEVLLWQ